MNCELDGHKSFWVLVRKERQRFIVSFNWNWIWKVAHGVAFAPRETYSERRVLLVWSYETCTALGHSCLSPFLLYFISTKSNTAINLSDPRNKMYEEQLHFCVKYWYFTEPDGRIVKDPWHCVQIWPRPRPFFTCRLSITPRLHITRLSGDVSLWSKISPHDTAGVPGLGSSSPGAAHQKHGPPQKKTFAEFVFDNDIKRQERYLVWNATQCKSADSEAQVFSLWPYPHDLSVVSRERLTLTNIMNWPFDEDIRKNTWGRPSWQWYS